MRTPPCSTVQLAPGDLLLMQIPTWVSTVLGSCVAVTMFAPTTRLAAICHAMLPEPRGTYSSSVHEKPHRFVSHALSEMLSAFTRQGVPRAAIEVKVFGGANVIAGARGHERRDSLLVGSSNLTAVADFMERESLSVRASNVGGTVGRKILFHTGTGEVLHRLLDPRPRTALA